MNLLAALVPHFFDKEPIPEITDPDLRAAIGRVRKTASVRDAMQLALDILSRKYTSKRFETYLLWGRMYEKDPNRLWERHGFLHCTQQNYLYRILLVNSGKVRDDDIAFGHSFVWYVSPHQFLIVRVNGKPVAVDTWNYQLGAKLGEYATGFGVARLS